jgi:hypothetical protein
MKEDSKEKKLSSVEEKMEGSPRRIERNTLEKLLQNQPVGLSREKKYEDDGELWED